MDQALSPGACCLIERIQEIHVGADLCSRRLIFRLIIRNLRRNLENAHSIWIRRETYGLLL